MKKLFALLQMRDNIKVVEKNAPFNQTELRLLGEVLSARKEGKRYISTRLADVLAITRSAVSQIVNRLEKRGVVKRVPDAVDKKIAYVEITDRYVDVFEKELKNAEALVQAVVEKMGEARFLETCDAFEDMLQIASAVVEEMKC